MWLRLGFCMVALFLSRGATASPSPPADLRGARPVLPLEGVITNPVWLHRPSNEELQEFYPKLATELRLSGRIKVNCVVTKEGALAGCTVSDEMPVGMGFGDAAVKMTKLMLMKPETLDGEPVGGGRFEVVIQFKPPDEESPSLAAEAGPPPSPTSMALGRRLSAAQAAEFSPTAIKAQMAVMRDQLGEGLSTPEVQTAFDAYEKTAVTMIAKFVDARARLYAASIPESTLAQIVGFFESPAGRQYQDVLKNSSEDDARFAKDRQRQSLEEARAMLCRRITCLPIDTPPPNK